MSTRSSIAMLNIDGTVHAHYCHSDGYISWNGQILFNNYQDVNKVKELISLGNMSILYPELHPPKEVEHSFDNRCKGVSIFYGRDRGETGEDTQKYESLDSYIKTGDFQEYNYIFSEKKNCWYLINDNTKKLQRLTTFLVKDKEVSDETKNIIFAEKEAKKLNKKLKTTNIAGVKPKL